MKHSSEFINEPLMNSLIYSLNSNFKSRFKNISSLDRHTRLFFLSEKFNFSITKAMIRNTFFDLKKCIENTSVEKKKKKKLATVLRKNQFNSRRVGIYVIRTNHAVSSNVCEKIGRTRLLFELMALGEQAAGS